MVNISHSKINAPKQAAVGSSEAALPSTLIPDSSQPSNPICACHPLYRRALMETKLLLNSGYVCVKIKAPFTLRVLNEVDSSETYTLIFTYSRVYMRLT